MLHRWKVGENLWEICFKYGITIQQLYTANHNILDKMFENSFMDDLPVDLYIPSASLPPQYNIVCICGSMRFYKTMLELAVQLTQQNYIVLMPFANKADIKSKDKIQHKEREEALDRLHKAKIDMADIVWIVDTDGRPTSYIGNSTMDEIQYAARKGKIINYLSRNVLNLYGRSPD